jgi:dihydroorotate dehydrogenase (NAD+) catalytic subunit
VFQTDSRPRKTGRFFPENLAGPRVNTMLQNVDLTVDIGGLKLKNPVLTASGTFGYGGEYASLVELNRLGGIVVKGLSLKASPGNPPPRIVETACGMLNAIGLENIGIENFIKQRLPFLRKLATPVIANIYGKTADEYEQLAARIDVVDGIEGIEVNISCPNVKAGGIAFGVDPEAAYGLVRAVRQQTDKPLMVKLSPNVTDIAHMATAVVSGGADCVSLINTITGMAVDVKKRRPKLANITGGLSGPSIKPIALRMVWQVAQAVDVPVVGIGGIATTEDALEFLIAGASAIQVGTANFINPRATMEIIDGIGAFLAQEKISSVRKITGTLQTENLQY